MFARHPAHAGTGRRVQVESVTHFPNWRVEVSFGQLVEVADGGSVPELFRNGGVSAFVCYLSVGHIFSPFLSELKVSPAVIGRTSEG